MFGSQMKIHQRTYMERFHNSGVNYWNIAPTGSRQIVFMERNVKWIENSIIHKRQMSRIKGGRSMVS
jgi:hypothetical protein